MATNVDIKTINRLSKKYGDRYAYENCRTIGYISKSPEELEHLKRDNDTGEIGRTDRCGRKVK